ncbi:uncharacterized protein LOC128745986 [Sabethes cyaneus]|uniref:uncharacterized protein LOC128745986 n=1 Tax=Sabethes cyaneus TaxID=53552 RepID=UPI00221E30A9|nr:uncharacterized protein LOC128745986 [Sabethes cyaneus]
MDEEEIPVLSGFLSIKSQSGFSIRNSRKKKYFQLFKASRNGIERLEISDSENDKNIRIVTLENCVKITVEHSPNNTINVVTKTGQVQLHSNNDMLIKQWKIALQSVAFREKSSNNGIVSANTIIEEDNDLYCSSYSEGIFTVTLIPTSASIKCGLEPKLYTLMLSSSDVLLKSYDDESFIVARWPYRFIRKYGYRDGKFTFEAGRMCDTGEGTFKLDNVNPQEIFRCMATIMKSMKNKINTGTPNKSHQLNVALRMEAGSRSPLPPSTSDTAIVTECHNSFRNLLTSSEITNTSSMPNHIVPCKPLRKDLSSNLNSKTSFKVLSEEYCHSDNSKVSSILTHNFNNFENSKEYADESIYSNAVPINSKSDREYECVEDITEAWKKLGIDNINHSENLPDNELCSSQELSSQHCLEKSAVCKKMNKNIDETYEKLNFFRTSYKSCGYKTVVSINPQLSLDRVKVNVSDDYEIVGEPTASSNNQDSGSSELECFDDNANQLLQSEPDISASRRADDSYLGYGAIRRPNEARQSITDIPAVLFTSLTSNEESHDTTQMTYSTVCKSKRL